MHSIKRIMNTKDSFGKQQCSSSPSTTSGVRYMTSLSCDDKFGSEACLHVMISANIAAHLAIWHRWVLNHCKYRYSRNYRTVSGCTSLLLPRLSCPAKNLNWAIQFEYKEKNSLDSFEVKFVKYSLLLKIILKPLLEE